MPRFVSNICFAISVNHSLVKSPASYPLSSANVTSILPFSLQEITCAFGRNYLQIFWTFCFCWQQSWYAHVLRLSSVAWFLVWRNCVCCQNQRLTELRISLFQVVSYQVLVLNNQSIKYAAVSCSNFNKETDSVVLKILLINEANSTLRLDIQRLLHLNVWFVEVFGKYLQINVLEVFLITQKQTQTYHFIYLFTLLFCKHWRYSQNTSKRSFSWGMAMILTQSSLNETLTLSSLLGCTSLLLFKNWLNNILNTLSRRSSFVTFRASTTSFSDFLINDFKTLVFDWQTVQSDFVSYSSVNDFLIINMLCFDFFDKVWFLWSWR